MSGREHEAVSAFFPSIDRNLILDLGRHLRTAEAAAQPAPAAEPQNRVQPTPPIPTHGAEPRVPFRPDVADVVEAVEQAAHSIAALTSRVEELEAHAENVESANGKLEEKLAAAHRAMQDLEARLNAETERSARVEAVAAQQAARASALDRELNAAHIDLARISDAIAATLGFPQRAG